MNNVGIFREYGEGKKKALGSLENGASCYVGRHLSVRIYVCVCVCVCVDIYICNMLTYVRVFASFYVRNIFYFLLVGLPLSSACYDICKFDIDLLLLVIIVMDCDIPPSLPLIPQPPSN